MPNFLPPKAIRINRLDLKDTNGLGPNSHGVCRATYTSDNDSELYGFFKPVSDIHHYPATLAIWSVMNSQLYRIFLGDNAAEERLVYYESGEIAGTFSIAPLNAKEFKPLLFVGEDEPDSSLRHYVEPTKETLLQLNMTQLLVTSWFLKEDDFHSAQVLFCHDGVDKDGIYINPRYVRIDFDMSLYEETYKIKGARFIDSIGWRALPEKNMRFTTEVVTDFPIFAVGGPYYWLATKGVTGYKDCKSADEFRGLPTASVLLESGKPTSFKLQKFEAILMQLLLCQPETIRPRLEDYVSVKKNADMIDEAVVVMENLYDEFYRETVFYQGDKETNDPAFKDFLRKRPSAFVKVLQFVEQMNLQFEEEERQGTFDINAMKQKYHQIWRDSYTLQFEDIRIRAYKVLCDLGKLVSIATESDPYEIAESIDSELPKKKFAIQTATKSVEVMQDFSFKNLENIEMRCDEKSSYRPAFETCKAVVPELTKIIKTYFNTPTDELSVDLNLDIIEKLGEAEKKLTPLLDFVGPATAPQENLRSLLGLIHDIKSDANLAEHYQKQMIGRDMPIDSLDRDDRPKWTPLPYNDPHVVSDVVKAIYKRAENKIELHQIIKQALKLYGESGGRTEHIKNYIKRSEASGANQLAYILSSGGWVYQSSIYKTSFNVYLMDLLVRQVDSTYLKPILNELKDNYFTDLSYRDKLVDYAKTSSEVFHPEHETAFPCFEDALYEWLKSQWELKKHVSLEGNGLEDSELVFEKILIEAITKYKKTKKPFSSLLFGSSSTGAETMLQEGKSYPYIFAEIINSSGQGEHSLAANLFRGIWSEVIASESKLNKFRYELHGPQYFSKVCQELSKVLVSSKYREQEDNDNLAIVATKLITQKSSGYFY